MNHIKDILQFIHITFKYIHSCVRVSDSLKKNSNNNNKHKSYKRDVMFNGKVNKNVSCKWKKNKISVNR